MTLSACGGAPTNRYLDSLKQPVVERTSMALEVDSAYDGLPISEQQRIDGWFDAMNLRYGDRLAVSDPTGNPAVFEAVEKLAARRGLLVNTDGALADGTITRGRARIVVTRSSANVPNCPDWSAKSAINYNNATYPNFGCSINGNLAAMMANPEDLIQGQQGTGETVVLTSTKAIDSYREQKPTGTNGLKESPTQGEGN
jgi:pilus assembly protein CpaD